MKVLIVSPCDLPIPAVRGGAVSTLIESIIKENELQKKLDLTIISVYDDLAFIKAKKYTCSKFIWIKPSININRLDLLIDKLNGSVAKRGIPKEYLRKLYVIQKVKEIISKNEYDVIIVENSGYLLNSFTKKTINKYKGRLYFHLHNDIPDSINKKVLRQVRFILISKYLSKKVMRICGNEVINKCFVVKNGINITAFSHYMSSDEKNNLKKKLGIVTDKRVIIFVGRIKPEKGLNELLNAMEILDPKQYCLIIVGSTNFDTSITSQYEIEIRSLCDRLSDRIVFTGYIPNSELWKYYSISDIAVLPSMWEEPAGLTLLEAALCKIPIISTRSGGIPEYLGDDKIILLERTDDISNNIAKQIEEVILNYNKYKEQAKYTCEYVISHFSEKEYYCRFLSAIQEKGWY